METLKIHNKLISYYGEWNVEITCEHLICSKQMQFKYKFIFKKELLN